MNISVIQTLTLIIISWLLLISYWQLEIVFIIATNELGWGYNFAGLGDFNLPLWFWRDLYGYYVPTILFICGTVTAFFFGRETHN